MRSRPLKRKKKLHGVIKTVDCWFCHGPYFVCVILTDVRSALIGVGLVVKDDKSGLSILDRGKVECYSKPKNNYWTFKLFFKSHFGH